MYWRVRKISPQQLVKMYGVYVVCAISILINLVSIAKLPSSRNVSSEQKINYEEFAKLVTQHLNDSCFLTYEQSMNALAFSGDKSELSYAVIQKLQPDETIPPTLEHFKAIARQLADTKSVSSTAIDDVQLKDLVEANINGKAQSFQPVEVSGKVVRHTAEGVTGPIHFHYKFLLGVHGVDTPTPVVVDFQDLSNQQEQNATATQ